MIIAQVRWSEVPDGGLIVGPSGRVWRMFRCTLPPNNLPGVQLVDPEGTIDGMAFAVDPNAPTTAILADDPVRSALAVLSRSFPLLEVIG